MQSKLGPIKTESSCAFTCKDQAGGGDQRKNFFSDRSSHVECTSLWGLAGPYPSLLGASASPKCLST